MFGTLNGLQRPIKTNEMYKEDKIPKEVHPSGKKIIVQVVL